MEAVLILADAAQVDPGGKAHMIGAGWTVTGPDMPPQAVVALIDVPWDATNQPHRIELRLLDADGQPVQVPGPTGEPQPLRLDQTVEVGRPPGVPSGTEIKVPLAINLGPGLPLTPGQRYRWQLDINGETREHWSAAFYVRTAQQVQ